MKNDLTSFNLGFQRRGWWVIIPFGWFRRKKHFIWYCRVIKGKYPTCTETIRYVCNWQCRFPGFIKQSRKSPLIDGVKGILAKIPWTQELYVIFSGPKTLRSNGCKTWVVWGGRLNIWMFSSRASSKIAKSSWEECPSRMSNCGRASPQFFKNISRNPSSLAKGFAHGRRCSEPYFS